MPPKSRTIAAQIPQSKEAAEADMRRLGVLRNKVERINTKLKLDSQKLTQKAGDAAKPFNVEIEKLEKGLTGYADAHRESLTDGFKSKTGKMIAGVFEWRKLPAKCSTRKVDDIIASISAAIAEAIAKSDAKRAARLQKFLRVKTEINKDAMLADSDAAVEFNGVSIGSEGERLEIIIHETSLPKT